MNQPLRIATWNVNSIKARYQHVERWLAEAAIDIALLQELKCEDAAFPLEIFEAMGYNVALHGQKTYNGVAILSKYPLDDIRRGLPENDNDPQARYIEGVVSLPGSALRVASVYVPNGQAVDSEKFPYKLAFLDRLNRHLDTFPKRDEAIIIGGDYNVAPEPRDVYDPARLDGSICFHPSERMRLRSMLHNGYYDAWRERNPSSTGFSWWDYRAGGYERGLGMRIDHLLCNAQALDQINTVTVDEAPRRWERPSDHAPVVASLMLHPSK